ncbi:ABC transporter ATP-binding protein [Micropruina sonneratiae]|uniref:ABC transporter ATP-binding protein n=1 Tax=Micropruina sonneratiae TaxID=2986940 RepID=UPI0022276C46|nr:ATP-binding cassette domain-containing protein [Micropruina sp. KQZ13P-5]MCW3157458.1 ATP-binding cassette domain-containing protein [Micropruina sp. KQZ13P-5]
MAIIETSALTRDYRRRRGTLRALDALDLSVRAGEAIGYLGANGSGKSTTIKLLTGILTPTAGTVRTCGLDPVPARRRLARRIGVVFGQRSVLWWDLPLWDSFAILAAMHRLPEGVWRPRVAMLVEELALGEFLAQPVRELSLGQRMRGEIAAALVHAPELLVLDEPTIGLDVLSKNALREFLQRERNERGTTLFLTTHDLGDVQRLCERMVIIDHGRAAFDGTAADLARVTGAERVLVADLAEPVDSLDLPPGARLDAVEAAGHRVRLSFRPGEVSAAALFASVAGQARVDDLTLTEPAIEDLVARIYTRSAE